MVRGVGKHKHVHTSYTCIPLFNDVLKITPRNGVTVPREYDISNLYFNVLVLIAQLPSNNLCWFEMLWLLYVL